MTLSRNAGDEDRTGVEPPLREAVLLVDGGKIDVSPLFRIDASGAYWLQFCEETSDLSADCKGAAEQDRVTVRLVDGKAQPVSFAKPDGIYRVRLWKMTPRGPQPTERNAIALAGSKARWSGTQRAFEEIAAPADGLAQTDPMIRIMLSAWLVESSR